MENNVTMPTEEGYKAGAIKEPKMTVSQVNKAIMDEVGDFDEAGDNKPLTPKQKEKMEKEANKYWNTMISRKEAQQMIYKELAETEQRLQMLFIQNRTLVELIANKGIATEEEINELSKSVIETIFGLPASEEKEKDEEKGTVNEEK